MDILEAIFTRRSIRQYTGELISDKQLKIVLRAGFYAPSAHNRQPWHFIIVKDKEKIASISEFHPYAKMAPSAGCVIVVCGDKKDESQAGFIAEDCSAAIQNMLLAAHGLGLGAVWCALHPVSKLTKNAKQLFDIPDDIIPVGLVVVGNKEKDRTVSERFKEDRLHYDKW